MTANDSEPFLSVGSTSADSAAIMTNGVRRLTVDSSGNVGIGTTTPTADLHIADTSALLLLQDTNGTVGGSMESKIQFTDSTGAVQAQVGLGTGTGFFLVDNNDGPMRVGTSSADDLYLSTNDADRMTIGSSGNVGIGTTVPAYRLDVGSASTAGTFRVYASGGGADAFRVSSNGVISTNIVNLTTASAANVFINTSNNTMYRSTSSLKYKTAVETLDNEHADIVFELRPVWYRSITGNDPEDHSYYGLIAEEVAEVDPRLVHFGASSDCGCVADEDGHIEHEQSCLTEPEGVFYERLVPHLINVAQRQQTTIDALTARIEALEANL